MARISGFIFSFSSIRWLPAFKRKSHRPVVGCGSSCAPVRLRSRGDRRRHSGESSGNLPCWKILIGARNSKFWQSGWKICLKRFVGSCRPLFCFLSPRTFQRLRLAAKNSESDVSSHKNEGNSNCAGSANLPSHWTKHGVRLVDKFCHRIEQLADAKT